MSTTTGAVAASLKNAQDIATAKLAISISLLLATYAISLIFHAGLSADRLQLMFLLPVLFITIAFGVWLGCGAALGALVALVLEPAPLNIDASSIVFFAILYLGMAWSIGFYADTVRWRRQEGEAHYDDRLNVQPHNITSNPRKDLDAIQPDRNPSRRAYVGNQFLAAAATTLLIVVSCTVAARLGATPKSPFTIFLLLAPVLAGAALYGTPIALSAAIVATLAQFGLLFRPMAGLAHSEFDVLASFLIFAFAGGFVGAFADRSRIKRSAIDALGAAGDALASKEAELEIWEVVFTAIAHVDRHISVRLTDEVGQVRREMRRKGAPPLIPPKKLGDGTVAAGLWRMRRLQAGERDLGVLSWHSPRIGKNEQVVVDHVLSSIAALAASAVVRVRLNVEKTEIESVARTEQLRTLLLDAVSHHFRTPLSSILGSVTTLLAPRHAAGSDREFLLIIKEQANRLDRYVDNFLGVARLESGSIDIDPEPVDLEPLLYDTWESFGEAGGARRFLEVSIDDRPVLADPSALKQILGNILENAIKYSMENTIVSANGRVVGSSMVFEVSDQGAGIPPADLPRIFGRFYRSREATASGLGLGLYISKCLVELMGGNIEALNRTDGAKGTTMRVVLPLATE